MSNTDLSTNQPSPTVDDLDGSPTKNDIVSSPDQEKSSPTSHRSNSYDKAMSDDIDSQVKKPIPETDIPPSKDNDFHLIKWIEFNYEHLPILLQNVNGPCPLLAIFNILLLRKRVRIFLIKTKKNNFLFIFYRLSLIQTWMQ